MTATRSPAAPVTNSDAGLAPRRVDGTGERRAAKRRLKSGQPEGTDRGILSDSDRRRPGIRVGMGAVNVVLFVVLVIACVGPIFLLFKFAITPTQDILRTPMELFPHGIAWDNVTKAWNDVHVSRYFLNTIIMAGGSWATQIIVATSGGYMLSVLKPRYAKYINGAVMATLFVPGVVLLVPLYLTVLNPPLLSSSLINSFWAVWLPAGASAFNIVLMTRFFDNLPREIFEAARVDGAGPFRLFWSIVLPMSKPILGVVSVFAIIAAWKDFLWPMLVLKDPNIQPLSVRLPNLEATTDLGVFLAALAISTIIPIALFLVFQRLFLSGAGLGGAVKG